MLFDLQSQEYDTDKMTHFSTGQSSMPTVHLTADGTYFLETHRDQWEKPRFRRIPRHEALRIAQLYHVTDLEESLAAKPEKPALATPPVSYGSRIDSPELIKQIHDMTPEQLEKLSAFLVSTGTNQTPVETPS